MKPALTSCMAAGAPPYTGIVQGHIPIPIPIRNRNRDRL